MIVVVAILADVIAVGFFWWIIANHRQRKRAAVDYARGLADAMAKAGLSGEPAGEAAPADERPAGHPPVPHDDDIPAFVAASACAPEAGAEPEAELEPVLEFRVWADGVASSAELDSAEEPAAEGSVIWSMSQLTEEPERTTVVQLDAEAEPVFDIDADAAFAGDEVGAAPEDGDDDDYYVGAHALHEEPTRRHGQLAVTDRDTPGSWVARQLEAEDSFTRASYRFRLNQRDDVDDDVSVTA